MASRRSAADSRRLSKESGGGRDTAKEIRKILKRAEDRGRQLGREERDRELPNANVRGSLLAVSIATLQQMEAETSQIPNSDVALAGYREAIAILQDTRSKNERLPASRKSVSDSDVKAIQRAQRAGIAAGNRAGEPVTPAKKAPAKKAKAGKKVTA